MHFPQQRPHHDILTLFTEAKTTAHEFLPVSAPMVRYSKLEFRKLLRKNGVKLTFTPMIIADSFNNSHKARLNEFTTSTDDEPVIAQFAARNASEFVKAAQLIYPYVDGIDLNCGCPQTWAIGKGYGVGLLRRPEIVQDIVQSVRRTLPKDFSVSVKLRLLSKDEDAKSTIELARQLEKCGVTFLSLHGRTCWQRSSDAVNVPAMASVKQALQVPLVVNGDVRSWRDACDLYEKTQADGVMAARGLLTNPALFTEASGDRTPLECMQQWLDIATRAGDNLHFQCFHHHLTFMCSSHMKRKLRLEFNNLTTKQQVFDFFAESYDLRPSQAAFEDAYAYTKCTYSHYETVDVTDTVDVNQWDPQSKGKFFSEFKGEAKDLDKDDDFDLGDSFFTMLDI